MKKWYVIHNKPRKEQFLYKQLMSREIDTYFPQIQAHGEKMRSHKLIPYFPRYLFVNVDLMEIGISALQWIPGAIGLVNYGCEPASIQEQEIVIIKNHVEKINDCGERYFRQLNKGDTVFIHEGLFKGYEAIFDAYLSGNERVRVFLKYLEDQCIRLEISSRSIGR